MNRRSFLKFTSIAPVVPGLIGKVSCKISAEKIVEHNLNINDFTPILGTDWYWAHPDMKKKQEN